MASLPEGGIKVDPDRISYIEKQFDDDPAAVAFKVEQERQRLISNSFMRVDKSISRLEG